MNINALRELRRIEFFNSKGNKCDKCGRNEDLQVDHIDPSTKHPKLQWNGFHSRPIWHLGLDEFREEAKKCQLLCLSCHTDKSLTERGLKRTTEHGLSMYGNYGCRCTVCRNAKSKESKRYYAKKMGYEIE